MSKSLPSVSYKNENVHRCVGFSRKLQCRMRRQVYNRGISVETNPSSNYLIGPIGKYEDHPILKFNAYLLDETCKRPLCVSINTDDQGVFDTSLENEYALMCLALQKMKKEDGSEQYHTEKIYKWLDYVRQLGLEQSFYKKI